MAEAKSFRQNRCYLSVFQPLGEEIRATNCWVFRAE